jgi:hypothetical protein
MKANPDELSTTVGGKLTLGMPELTSPYGKVGLSKTSQGPDAPFTFVVTAHVLVQYCT